MANNTHPDGKDQPDATSSMSVSQQVVCEGEACIGKGENSETVQATPDTRLEKKAKSSTHSSMDIDGEEICSDDACIGKNDR